MRRSRTADVTPTSLQQYGQSAAPILMTHGAAWSTPRTPNPRCAPSDCCCCYCCICCCFRLRATTYQPPSTLCKLCRTPRPPLPPRPSGRAVSRVGASCVALNTAASGTGAREHRRLAACGAAASVRTAVRGASSNGAAAAAHTVRPTPPPPPPTSRHLATGCRHQRRCRERRATQGRSGQQAARGTRTADCPR